MTNAPQYQTNAAQPNTNGDYPGKTLGLVGLILAIVIPLVGLILSLVAKSQSKKAGYENKLAKIGVIVGAILTVLTIIGFIYNVTVLLPALTQAGY